MNHRSPHSRVTLVAVALAALVALSACNDDGRELRAAPPPTSPPVSTGPEMSGGPTLPFGIFSPALEDAGPIQARYTCDGAGDFLPLSVQGIAPNMVELAIVVTDVTTDHVHMVLAGLPGDTVNIDANVGLPEAAVFGTSTGGVVGWEPPCPPPGDEAHQYKFSLYAFAEPIGMTPGLSGEDALDVLPQSAIGFAELTGFYARA